MKLESFLFLKKKIHCLQNNPLSKILLKINYHRICFQNSEKHVVVPFITTSPQSRLAPTTSRGFGLQFSYKSCIQDYYFIRIKVQLVSLKSVVDVHCNG